MAFIRLIIFGFIGLTVVYFAVTWFARSTRRERLEKKWDAKHPGGDPVERARVVERGVVDLRLLVGVDRLHQVDFDPERAGAPHGYVLVDVFGPAPELAGNLGQMILYLQQFFRHQFAGRAFE